MNNPSLSRPPACAGDRPSATAFLAARLACLLALAVPLAAQTPYGVPGNWTLTLNEEFDGTALNPHVWRRGTHHEGIAGQGGNARENTTVGSGRLTVTAEQRAVQYSAKSFAYATGEISTLSTVTTGGVKQGFSQRYGYFEARMRWDQATGMWPAFWLMPDRGYYGPQSTGIPAGQSEPWGGFERSYVKFVTGFGSPTAVTSAILRLKLAALQTPAPTTNKPNVVVMGVADDFWSETGIIWNNMPVPEALWYAQSYNDLAVGSYIDFDVTAFVAAQAAAGDKTYSFCLADTFLKSNRVTYYSREAAAPDDRPMLIINGGNYEATADAMVAAGDYANTNYGTTTTLKIRDHYFNTASTGTDSYGQGMEIDIMETLGIWGKNETSHATHWDGYGSTHKARGWGPVPAYNTDTTFRTYGLYWQEGLLEFYVDGVKTGEQIDPRVMNTPAFILLSLQLGGWDGNVPSVAVHGKKLDVDYVRVWSGTRDVVPVPATTTLLADGSVRFGRDSSGYGGNTASEIVIADGGTALTMSKDGWAKFPLNYTVTPDTVLEFTVESVATGEILAIGLEEDDVNNLAPKRLFHLAGTENWANAWTEFRDYISGSGLKTYIVPIGQFYTGPMTYLAFANDNDLGNRKVSSRYSQVRIQIPVGSPPAAPTGLTATAVSSSQIDLSWTASSGATSYNVKRATVSGGPHTTIATGVTGTTHSSGGLVGSTTYYYVVSAVNSGGESGNSAQASATTLSESPPPPPAPTGVTATAVSSNQISLTWTASPGATSYNVRRATVSGGPYTTIATGVPGTTLNSGGLAAATTYYYVVSAVSSSGESANSAQASATTFAGPPAAPTSLTATAGDAQVALSWTASSGATSYNIKRSTTSGGPYTTVAAGVTATTYTNTGLTNGTTYYYVVSAINSGDESANSAEASATPQVASGWNLIDDNLSGYTAGWTQLGSSGSITQYSGHVTIVDNSTTSYLYMTKNGFTPPTGAFTFEVRAKANAAGTTNEFTARSGSYKISLYLTHGTTGSAQDKAASPTKTYALDTTVYHTYRIVVQADYTYDLYVDGALAWSGSTNQGTGTNIFKIGGDGTPLANMDVDDVRMGTGLILPAPPTPQPPAAPTSLTATAGDAQVSLSWTASSGATSYTVKRATVSGGPYTIVATGVTTANYTNTSLSNGTTYYYVVSAVNAVGESANSAQVSATPQSASAVLAPTNLTATAGKGKISLSWTQSTSPNLKSNEVYRSSTSGGPYTLLATFNVKTTYNDTVPAGTTYYYVVTAANTAGAASPYSNQAGATAK